MIVVPVMLIMLWFTVSVTMSTIISRSHPDLAIALYGDNSRALERAATVASVKLDPASARQAETFATRSLIASPLSSEGAAALAVAKTALDARANGLPAVQYSQFLSRRTIIAQIWLIEHWAAQGDVGKALQAYDRLFRISDSHRKQFLPVLLAASAQPEVTKGVAKLLQTRPPWRGEYFGGLLGAYPGSDNFALLIKAMGLNTKDVDDAKRLTLGLSKLVESGRPDLAYELYRVLAQAGTDPTGLVRNGQFARSDGIAPFDWEFAQTDELSAEPGTNEAGRPALQLINRGGRAGMFARQLLMLLPGNRYTLGFTIGGVSGAEIDRPKIIVQCQGSLAVIATMAFPTAPITGRTVRTDIAVPKTGCTAQWLIIQAGNPIDVVTDQQWLTNVHVSANQSPAGSVRRRERN
jgi:hypothetical protein